MDVAPVKRYFGALTYRSNVTVNVEFGCSNIGNGMNYSDEDCRSASGGKSGDGGPLGNFIYAGHYTIAAVFL